MPQPRILAVALLGFLGLGCGESSPPPFYDAPASPASAGQYQSRTDFLVVGKTGLDGTPRQWHSAGFPPMKSARIPTATPDRDLADDIRKQLNRTVLDPTSRLSASQSQVIDRMLEANFGTPAEPRVRVPGWNEVRIDALYRPESQGMFANLWAFGTALSKWEGYRITKKALDALDDAGVPGAVLKQLAPLNNKNFNAPQDTADAIAKLPEAEQLAQYRDLIVNYAHKSRSVGPRLDWEGAEAAKAALKLDDATLARGSVLYRRWCMQCHGPSGAGDGTHAIQLAAIPRDYRQGIFKFITTYPPPGQPKKGAGPAGKPLRDDLTRTIRRGIDGSMMPAFPTLSDAQLDDLVSYVIHLSVRGETEFATMNKAMNPTEEDPDFVGMDLRWLFDQNLTWVLHNWSVAQTNRIPIPPENTPTAAARLASAARGAQNYTTFGCAACHANYGREPQLKWDLWGGVVQPRNLVLGVYRGGRRGEDLYARVYGGIYPSGMPNHVEKLAGSPSDPDQPDKIWDLVHFLQAVADPADRIRVRDLVRKTDPTFNIEP